MGLLGFAASLAVATVTAPVGFCGAVFLLPIQLSVLDFPTQHSIPGALARYRASLASLSS